jgi:hypothetical protein
MPFAPGSAVLAVENRWRITGCARQSALMCAVGLDQDGFIEREGALARVPQAFAPVVDAARAAIRDSFGRDRLHSSQSCSGLRGRGRSVGSGAPVSARIFARSRLRPWW